MEHKITLTYTENKDGSSKCKIKVPLDTKAVTVLSAIESGKNTIINLMKESCIDRNEVNDIEFGELMKRNNL